MKYLFYCVFPDLVTCPLFSDDVIVQQPADYLNLTNQYVAHAQMAISKAVGKLCMKVFNVYLQGPINIPCCS